MFEVTKQFIEEVLSAHCKEKEGWNTTTVRTLDDKQMIWRDTRFTTVDVIHNQTCDPREEISIKHCPGRHDNRYFNIVFDEIKDSLDMVNGKNTLAGNHHRDYFSGTISREDGDKITFLFIQPKNPDEEYDFPKECRLLLFCRGEYQYIIQVDANWNEVIIKDFIYSEDNIAETIEGLLRVLLNQR